MPDVISQMANVSTNVRKHANQILAIADYSTAVPTSFFAEDGLPIALPTGFKNMGYITTKGLVEKHDSKTDDTTMLQDIEPVRSDLSSASTTFTVAFGEVNAWTKALRYGLAVSDWAASKDAHTWSFDEGAAAANPFYRALFLSQDGTGADAVYRVKFYYRVQITDYDDATYNRSDEEDTGFTFTAFRDPVVNKFLTDTQSVKVATQG